MINFFRNIRKTSLSRKRIGKYLLYAIGEIILVVIGILIAVQINNWNDNRKLESKEIAGIQNLIEEIEFNNTVLKSVIDVDSTSVQIGKNLMLILKDQETEYQDYMSYDFLKLFESRIFISRKTAYENLKSIDFNVIKSDSIRMNISLIYDGLYNYLDNQQNTSKYESSRKLRTIIQDNFEQITPNRIIPNDFHALKQNKHFTNALSFYIFRKQEAYEQNKAYYYWLEDILANLKNYLEDIKRNN